ncbi:MAG TPA: MJ0042-type zinc finger domain-containing protein [Planctomycetaceae bacterium]
MAIEFECPACDATIRVKDEAAGKKGRCPKCRTLLLVPDPGPDEEPAPAPPEPEPPAPPLAVAPPAPAAPPEPAVEPEPPVEPEPVAAPVIDPSGPFPLVAKPAFVRQPPVRSRRSRRRYSTRTLVTAVTAALGLAVVAAGGWLLYKGTGPDLSGTITGERLGEVALTPVTVPAPGDAVPKEDIEAVMGVLASEGLPLKSEYVAVLLTGEDGQVRVAVDTGPRAAAVRVPLASQPAVKAALALRRDAILRAKQSELRDATAGLFRDYAAYLETGTPMTRLPEYRDQVALNASVAAAGYAVEAVVSGTAFPCVYEDANGRCYFFPPAGTRSFRLRGRKLADGTTPLPVDFEVTVVEASAPAPEPEPPAAENDSPEPAKQPATDQASNDESDEAPAATKPAPSEP